MKTRLVGVTLLIAFPLTNPLFAGGRSKAAREVAEVIAQKFGKAATKDGVESLTAKIEALAVRHGEGAYLAVRKVGPRAIHLVEEAGPNGTAAVKLMAHFGEDAVWVVNRPKSLALFVKYGNDAGQAMIRHKGIAEPLLEKFGEEAGHALVCLDGPNGRRFAILMSRGDLERIGRTPELLKVISRYGDSAMKFVWEHREALAGSAFLAAFLADPAAFLDRDKDR